MPCTLDFRRLDEGLGGQRNKRKRSDEREIRSNDDMQVEKALAKRSAITVQGQDKFAYGKSTYDSVIAGKVSRRKWKQPKRIRTSALKVSLKHSSFEEKSRLKEINKVYKERMTELKEQIRQNKVEKRKQKEDREKRKEENRLKSGSKLQKITNPESLNKISKSKKQKKLLRVVADESLKK